MSKLNTTEIDVAVSGRSMQNMGAATGASSITVKRALNSFGGTIVNSQHSVSPPVRYRDGLSVKYTVGEGCPRTCNTSVHYWWDLFTLDKQTNSRHQVNQCHVNKEQQRQMNFHYHHDEDDYNDNDENEDDDNDNDGEEDDYDDDYYKDDKITMMMVIMTSMAMLLIRVVECFCSVFASLKIDES